MMRVFTLAFVAVSMIMMPLPASATSSLDSAPTVDFETVANLDELTVDHATLFRLYWAFFLREPDGSGALYWIERQERCDGLAAMAEEFASGEEFANRYGSLDDSAFVEQIYHNVLGRRGEAEGLDYWTDLVINNDLSRGEMVLHVSQSTEFRAKHQYPSDEVPGRDCRLPGGQTPTARSFVEATGQLLATIDLGADGGAEIDVSIMAPASIIEYAGFHQSSHPGAQGMIVAQSTTVPTITMAGRNRETHSRGAIDIAVHPLVPITAPVTGRVERAGDYILYCKYRDGFVVIKPDGVPDGVPDLEVKIFHIQDVSVQAGDWVTVGDPIAGRATLFPFRSQVDEFTAEPSWPHVHIETVDPSIPRKPSSGSC